MLSFFFRKLTNLQNTWSLSRFLPLDKTSLWFNFFCKYKYIDINDFKEWCHTPVYNWWYLLNKNKFVGVEYNIFVKYRCSKIHICTGVLLWQVPDNSGRGGSPVPLFPNNPLYSFHAVYWISMMKIDLRYIQ